MATGEADRNLLLGMLALQNNFVDREALLTAFNVRIADKARPVGQVLVARRLLTAEERALLEALAAKHLEKFGHDPRGSCGWRQQEGPPRFQGWALFPMHLPSPPPDRARPSLSSGYR